MADATSAGNRGLIVRFGVEFLANQGPAPDSSFPVVRIFSRPAIEVLTEKRQRERARKQKQQDKEQRRAQRAAQKQQRALNRGKDGGLEGIVPGPQPGQIMVDLP